MTRVEHIGAATLYLGLTKSQRHRLRKAGVDVPLMPRKRGYTQTVEHVEKRKRKGEASHHWLGDNVSPKIGRQRALRLFPEIGPCIVCGDEKSERHHKDENPANNAPENIAILCRPCHVAEHARLRLEKGRASCAKK